MSIFYKLFFLTFFISTGLISENVTPELSAINHSIESLKQNVQNQEKIRIQLILYQKINKEFLKNPDDKELLFQMVKLADTLFENIKKSHMTQNFSPEFLSELTLFSQIASKRGVPKP